eukprot:1079573-Pelagomonas_calceolata.AAC.20
MEPCANGQAAGRIHCTRVHLAPAGMYDAMRELDRQHGVSTVLDGTVVKGLTRYSQRFVENFYSNSRLEVCV